MAVRIEDLISMGDIDTLHEIMTEDDNWMNQLEAAEGLVKLRDKRGLEFLVNAEHNEDRKVRELVREILGTPEILLQRVVEAVPVPKVHIGDPYGDARANLEAPRV